MRFFTFFLAIFLVIFNSNAFALGKLGHQLVCELAYQQLEDVNKQKIEQLLSTLPASEKEKINQYNYAKKGSKLTLAKACTWPDAVKNEAKYKQLKSWHYVNVDRNKTSLDTHSCQKGCITQAIPFHQQQFQHTSDSLKKAKALMFLGHWLGDIHQPLHVSFASDLGGNKTAVKNKYIRCESMHWLWDECLLTNQTTEKKLHLQFNALLPKLASISPQDKRRWQDSNVIDWANESLVIARATDTQYCQQMQGSCQVNHQQPIHISKDYLNQHGKMLNTRVQQAAVRLAKLLDSML